MLAKYEEFLDSSAEGESIEVLQSLPHGIESVQKAIMTIKNFKTLIETKLQNQFNEPGPAAHGRVDVSSQGLHNANMAQNIDSPDADTTDEIDTTNTQTPGASRDDLDAEVVKIGGTKTSGTETTLAKGLSKWPSNQHGVVWKWIERSPPKGKKRTRKGILNNCHTQVSSQ